ncbi:IS5 family transposase [Streptomyces kurssanovii]|nr:IS5 family transposase [Streptomyces kurssanovii]
MTGMDGRCPWASSARTCTTARAWSPSCAVSRPSGPSGARGASVRRNCTHKGYDYDHLRRWLRERGIRHRIARKGVESSQRLGRHRWVVERTVSWLAGCRRLHRRYERKAEHFLAIVGIAATLIGYRRLIR